MQGKESERGVPANRCAANDAAAYGSNVFEPYGRVATWFPKGKSTFTCAKSTPATKHFYSELV
jgi:hypothetical protein